MNPTEHPQLNVLCILRGFETPEIKHKITPYRVECEDGSVHYVKEVRHCSKHKTGWTYLFQFVVRTKEDHFLEIWFDGHTYNWCITEEQTKDGIVFKY